MGLLLHAQAQLTNQVAITPYLNFGLLKESAVLGTNRFNASDEILFEVSAKDGNGGVFALLPFKQTFIFDLRDANGRLIPKTEAGIEHSKSVDVTKGSRELGIRHNPISAHHSLLNNLFVPENYFIITNTGVYTLDVQIRAWVQKTNGQYGVVISPPVRVEIEKK